MEMTTLTGLGQTEMVFFAMIVGLVLTAYLIARFGVTQGKSFWQIFFLSLLVGPVVGVIIAAVPGMGVPMNNRVNTMRP